VVFIRKNKSQVNGESLNMRIENDPQTVEMFEGSAQWNLMGMPWRSPRVIWSFFFLVVFSILAFFAVRHAWQGPQSDVLRSAVPGAKAMAKDLVGPAERSESPEALVKLERHYASPNGRARELAIPSGALIGCTALLVLFVGAFARMRSSTRPRAKLISDRDERLNVAVETARADERSRIAREIHDELGALLMVLKIDLKCLSKNTATARRATDHQWPEVLEKLDAVTNVVAKIAGEVRPCMVDQLSLWGAIDTYACTFEEATKIPLQMRRNVEESFSDVDAAREIFRIVQESLTNIARHAKASTVSIAIDHFNDHLNIAIEDDGIGISPHQILDTRAVGFTGMFERARILGAELHIEPRTSGGTRIVLCVPWQRSSEPR
jgi:signal transduction histidine kinase